MLTLALERVEFLPPGRATDDTSILTLRNLVFEPLCRWRDGVVAPGLLTGWTHATAGLEWRFPIRAGATFHDGRPCMAEDVASCIGDYLAGHDTFGMPWAYARYLAAARIEPAARDVLRIATAAPFADLPEVLAEFFAVRATPAGDPVLGTGPYRVEDHAVGRADLRAVDAAREPARIRLLALPEAEARHAALLAGGAEAAANLERLRTPPRRGPELAWGQAANTLSVMFYLNCRGGLFASAGARLAANLAVDVPAIIADVFHGLAVPASTVVSPFHLGHPGAALPPLPHDPARARALFEEAGAGTEILIRTPTHMPERAVEVSRRVAHDLGRVGVPARIEVVPDRPAYARAVGRGEIGDMAIFDSSPASTFRVLSDKVSSTVRGTWWQGHDDPELEPLIAAAGRCMDRVTRAALYARCLRRLRENPPWLYLLHPVEVYAARRGTPPLRLDHRGVLTLDG